MKYVVYAIVLALSVPLYSQEIRLDSLWIKMGGYPVMAFSPDSKFLLLGQADGIVNIVEVETGTAVDTITLPKNGYADFRFSPDGKTLIVSEKKQITLYSSSTWDSIGVISGLPSPGSLSISPDGRLIAVSEYYGGIAVIDFINRRLLRTITRPSSYKGSNNQDIPFNNGRVNFNSDGTLLYGKYAEEFGSWDLTKANTPFVRKMTIGNRAVIGFTPDNRYMIQQSNYIWDLNTKAQVQIEGLESYYSEVRNTFCTTPKGELTVVTQQNRFAAFIDIPKRKMLSVTPLRLAYGIQISPDSMYLAHNYGDGAVFLKKIQWTVSNVETELHTAPTITISPIPGKESLQLYIHLRQASPSFDVKIHDISGKYIETLYSGSVELGEQRYTLDTKSYSSGKYYVVLSNNGSIQSYPFIITK
jgi:WD40 repeat protein